MPVRPAAATLRTAIIAGLAISLAAPAFAQNAGAPERTPERTVVRRSAGGSRALPMLSAPPALSKERLHRYAKVLALDADQTTAAEALYDAYVTQVQRSEKDLRDRIKESSGEVESLIPAPGGGGSAKLSGLAQVIAENRVRGDQLRDQFLADLRSILRPEQGDNWAALERLRRRDNYLARGSLSGSTLDLLAIVDALRLSDAQRAPLKEALDRYEINLDRALLKREAFFGSADKIGVQTFNPESFKARQDTHRSIDVEVKDVNVGAARQLAELVPAEHRATFDALVQRHTYRTVYKEPSAARKIAAAQDLKTLTPQQREQLSAALERYQRDAAQVNQRWADAIAKAESAGRPTGSDMMLPGGKLDPELADARKARRELDNTLKQALEAALSPEQLEALPKPQGIGAGRAISVTAVADGSTGQGMTFVSEDELDEDEAEGLAGGGPAIMIIEDHRMVGPDGQPVPTPPAPPPSGQTPPRTP